MALPCRRDLTCCLPASCINSELPAEPIRHPNARLPCDRNSFSGALPANSGSQDDDGSSWPTCLQTLTG